MSKRSPVEPEPSPRFLKRPETVATLAQAEDTLSALNDDFFSLSFDQNPGLSTQPYEGAILFTLDTRPTDRASAIIHTPAYGLERTGRLEYPIDSVAYRRVILSRTALGEGLKKDKTPTFRTSRMNPAHQLMWASPLVIDTSEAPEHAIAAVQLGYTINQHPEWTYPTNSEVEEVWHAHRRPLAELSRALGSLASKTDSLSKSLEIAPPVTSDSYVIQWDIHDSTRKALSNDYPAFEAYLEAWKQTREAITRPYGAKILDRGEGEFIIVPLTEKIDVHNPVETTVYGKREIHALVEKLLAAHEKVAGAFTPDIFPHIYMGVGLGTVEEDQNNNPTGQVLWDVARTTRNASPDTPVSYTKKAAEVLFDN